MFTFLLEISQKIVKVYKSFLFGHVVEIPTVVGTRPAIDELAGALRQINMVGIRLNVNFKRAEPITVEMTDNGNAIVKVPSWGWAINILRTTTPVTGDNLRWVTHVPARTFPLSELYTMAAAITKAQNVAEEIR